MTRPRRLRPPQRLVALDGDTLCDMAEYAAMMDAYCADHPDFVAPRSGVRGDAARLGLRGLPDDWWRPYAHLLAEEGPDGFLREVES